MIKCSDLKKKKENKTKWAQGKGEFDGAILIW
jgi:hypothetical protein